MTDNTIRRLAFKKAAREAEDATDSINTKKRNAPDYLRVAMMKLIEGWQNHREMFDFYQYGVAYGEDKAQHDQWGDRVDWWDAADPHHNASRIRVEAINAETMAPPATRLMEAIGATFVLHETGPALNFMPAAKDNDNDVYHFIQDHESETIEEFRDLLHERHYEQAAEEQSGLA